MCTSYWLKINNNKQTKKKVNDKCYTLHLLRSKMLGWYLWDSEGNIYYMGFRPFICFYPLAWQGGNTGRPRGIITIQLICPYWSALPISYDPADPTLFKACVEDLDSGKTLWQASVTGLIFQATKLGVPSSTLSSCANYACLVKMHEWGFWMLSVYVLLAMSHNFLKFPSLSFSPLLLLHIWSILLVDKFAKIYNLQIITKMGKGTDIIQNLWTWS